MQSSLIGITFFLTAALATHAQADQRADLAQIDAWFAAYRSPDQTILAEYDIIDAAAGVIVVAYSPKTRAYFKFNNQQVWLRMPSGQRFSGNISAPLTLSDDREERWVSTLMEWLPQVVISNVLDTPQSVEFTEVSPDGVARVRARFRGVFIDKDSPSTSENPPAWLDLWIGSSGRLIRWQYDSYKQPVECRYAEDSPPGYALIDRFDSGTWKLRRSELVTRSDEDFFDPENVRSLLLAAPPPRRSSSGSQGPEVGADNPGGSVPSFRTKRSMTLILVGIAVLAIALVEVIRRRR